MEALDEVQKSRAVVARAKRWTGPRSRIAADYTDVAVVAADVVAE